MYWLALLIYQVFLGVYQEHFYVSLISYAARIKVQTEFVKLNFPYIKLCIFKSVGLCLWKYIQYHITEFVNFLFGAEDTDSFLKILNKNTE